MASNHEQVHQWCASLGLLTAVRMPREEANVRLAAYVPLLANEFPPPAFNTSSLQYVAAHCAHGFPTYGELATALAAWWREHRPAPLPPPALPNPEQCPLDSDGRPHRDAPRHLIEAWYRHNWDNPDGVQRLVRRCQDEAPQLLTMLREAVTRWAPHLANLVPAYAGPPPSPLRREDERPKPRHLTPEQLDQLNPLPNGRQRAPPSAPTDDEAPRQP